MAFRGNLEDMGVAEILQMLNLGKKTGRLLITNGEKFIEVYIEKGNIVFGRFLGEPSKSLKSRLENKLGVKLNISLLGENITRQLLNQNIKEEVIKNCVENVVKDIFNEIILWKKGFWEFEVDVKINEDVKTSLDPINLLIDITTQIDEWEKIKSLLPSLDNVYVADKYVLIKENLTESEKEIIKLFDGKKTLEEILDASPYNPLETGKLIHRFLTKGWIKKVEIKDFKRGERGMRSGYHLRLLF